MAMVDLLERRKATELALQQALGKGSVVLGSEASLLVETIPTRSEALNEALGGGFPVGRIIEIFGKESTGKTTLALEAIADVQAQGGLAAIVDLEKFDPGYAAALGVDLEMLLVSRPADGKTALKVCEHLIKTIDIVVIDSVTALNPSNTAKGAHARMMSQGLRSLNSLIAQHNCTLIFTNQLRCTGSGGSGPEESTGGQALNFYAHMRLDLTRLETIGDKNRPHAIKVGANTVKSKTGIPGRKTEFFIRFGQGIEDLSL